MLLAEDLGSLLFLCNLLHCDVMNNYETFKGLLWLINVSLQDRPKSESRHLFCPTKLEIFLMGNPYESSHDTSFNIVLIFFFCPIIFNRAFYL